MLLVLLAGLATDGGAAAEPSAPMASHDASIYDAAVDMTLASGDRISLRDLRGRARIVFMFFTHCPAACPVTVQQLKGLERSLEPASQRNFRVLLVSFDARDDASTLARFSRDHRLDATRWTVSAAEPPASEFLSFILGTRFRQMPTSTFSHNPVVVLIDAEGRVVARTMRVYDDPAFSAAAGAVFAATPTDSDATSLPLTEAQVLEWLHAHPAFLLEHPELLSRAGELKRQRIEVSDRLDHVRVLNANRPLLERLRALSVGPPDSQRVLFAFVDYECLPCRADRLQMEQLAETHPAWRRIDIPLGILSSASLLGVDAVLAARAQGLARELHDALMRAPLPLTYGRIIDAARGAGLAIDRLEIDMRDASVHDEREALRHLAEELGVRATPTYLYECELRSGPLDPSLLDSADSCPALSAASVPDRGS